MIRIISTNAVPNRLYKAVCYRCNSKFIFDDVEVKKVYEENKDLITTTDNKAIKCPVCGKLHTFMVYNDNKILSGLYNIKLVHDSYLEIDIKEGIDS